MKFSERWLREWANPPVDSAALCERLTLSGLEVEQMTPVAAEITGVVVAEVRVIGKHPNADKLSVCQVSTGSAAPLSVVTGAANVRTGMRVPLAPAGALLADGRRIEKSSLRGMESHGVLCSATELGMVDAGGEGILELPSDAPLGANVRDYLQLDDARIEINLTPNRGDCLSIAGLAREVGAEHHCPLRLPEIKSQPPAHAGRLPITLTASEACPRYAGRVINGIDAAAATPMWLRERLRRSGLRSISAVVDVTNYVMLELGQPMHAFDLARLKGGITVRYARAGEQLELLDGQQVTVDAETLVIADDEKPVAMAGIMGGRATGVGDITRDIFLESAFFSPTAIAGRPWRYKLHTDSAHRFERGVDYLMTARAMERATALILQICGGRPGPVCDVTHKQHLPVRAPIRLRQRRLEQVLGFSCAADEVIRILEALGVTVKPAEDGWQVLPPSYRFDISIEEDLIEEMARILGYERVPSRAPGGRLKLGPLAEAGKDPLMRFRQTLIDRGYHEAITYSFVDPAHDAKLGDGAAAIALTNPISEDMAVMRTSLWPGLVKALHYNQNRQQSRIRLFEMGRIFRSSGKETSQIMNIAGVIAGDSAPEQWGCKSRPVDFYDLKSDCEALLAGLQGVDAVPGRHPALHPGQSADWVMAGNKVGSIGALRPDLYKDLDLKGPVYLFELALAPLAGLPIPRHQPLSKFPLVRRDLSFTLAADIPVQKVTECIWRGAPLALRDLQLFDVYQGEGIDSGKKSIALGLIFQQSSSTLMDTEVEVMVTGIAKRLAGELGASLRE
ncbi:MAG TPA: phenylalanine--tRNA ligase subunit beta [Gammaproteobacteria bacterium]|nr:phenylalanine--tRNA ligase subunit beta [Gammaproteobacteria bacterium]